MNVTHPQKKQLVYCVGLLELYGWPFEIHRRGTFGFDPTGYSLSTPDEGLSLLVGLLDSAAAGALAMCGLGIGGAGVGGTGVRPSSHQAWLVSEFTDTTIL